MSVVGLEQRLLKPEQDSVAPEHCLSISEVVVWDAAWARSLGCGCQTIIAALLYLCPCLTKALSSGEAYDAKAEYLQREKSLSH